MACLQYSPAPVVFAQKTYNRSELLGVRERLLAQAASKRISKYIYYALHIIIHIVNCYVKYRLEDDDDYITYNK